MPVYPLGWNPAETALLGGEGGTPTGPAGGDLGGSYPNPSVSDDSHAHTSSTVTPASIGAAPATVDYLVGTASAGLSAEIAVGTTPGGELGGTWASPTVDTTHSGSTHAAAQAAAEATASTALGVHAAAADPHTGYQRESEKAAASGYASLDSGTKVPVAQLGSGTPDGTKFLRDDRTFAVPSGTAAIANGTAFPGSPSTNDFYHRNDRGVLYQYNGTRWLGPIQAVSFVAGSAQIPYGATLDSAERVAAPWAAVYDLWLVDFQLTFYIESGTALSGSHKWDVDLKAASTIATITINSGASSAWRSAVTAIGALLGTSNLRLYTLYTKTGTPGNIYPMWTLTYRLVG